MDIVWNLCDEWIFLPLLLDKGPLSNWPNGQITVKGKNTLIPSPTPLYTSIWLSINQYWRCVVAVYNVFRAKWKGLYASGFEVFKYSKGDGTQSGRKWYSRRKGCLAHLFTDYVSDTLLNGERKPEPRRNLSW